jgi:hypothetical protein
MEPDMVPLKANWCIYQQEYRIANRSGEFYSRKRHMNGTAVYPLVPGDFTHSDAGN